MIGEAPRCGVGGCHVTVTEFLVTFTMVGTDGAAGNMAGSGARCSRVPGDSSTLSDADQEVSPLSEEAVHVYRPESDTSSSKRHTHMSHISIITTFIIE